MNIEEQVFSLEDEQVDIKAMSPQEFHAYMMPKEARGERPAVTRKGTITQVLQAGKDRLLVLSCFDNYVYMFDEDLPPSMQEAKNEALIDQKVRFKPIAIEDDKVIVSHKVINDTWEKAIESGKILRGKVIELRYYPRDQRRFFLVVKCRGDKVLIPYSELPKALSDDPKEFYMNRVVSFCPLTIKKNTLYGSIAIAHEFHLYQLEKLFSEGETVRAIVEELPSFGAILRYKDSVELRIRNKDFSLDYTRCEDVLSIGDKIRVRFVETSPTGHIIFVAPYEKYQAAPVDLSGFEVGQEYDGKVVRVSSFGCFVRVAPGKDLLCPISFDQREPKVNENVKVVVKVNDPDANKFRGKIVKREFEKIDLSEYDLL